MPVAVDCYYTEAGQPQSDNLTLILVHGAGGNLLSFPVALRRLPRYHVLALDLPGHGRSAGVGLQSIAAYTQRIVDFMNAVGVYRAVWVGWSMGGAIALQASVQAPEQVCALAVLSAGAYFPLNASLLTDLSSKASLKAALDRLQGDLFAPQAGKRLVEQSMRLLQEVRQGVLYSDWKACAAFDLRKRLKDITTPVWIASGSHDRLVPPAIVRHLAAHLPNAHLQMVENAGHMLVQENTAAVQAGLLEFLAGLPVRFKV